MRGSITLTRRIGEAEGGGTKSFVSFLETPSTLGLALASVQVSPKVMAIEGFQIKIRVVAQRGGRI